MSNTSPAVALDRRTLLASGAALAAVGVAGCSDLRDSGEDDERAEPKDPIAYVPASASVVAHVDMALTESDETMRLIEAYAGEGNEDVLERIEQRTGVDPEKVNEVVAFSTEPRAERMTLVVDADLDDEAVRNALEDRRDAEYEPVDHENGTIFRPTDADESDDALVVGTVAQGQYVVGSETNVRTALDVFAGDEDPLEGSLRNAFDDAREHEGEGEQYVTAATDELRAYLPPDDSEQVPAGVSLDIYEEVETATVTYATHEGQVDVNAELRTPDEDTAGQVRDFTGTVKMYLRNQVEDPEVGAQLAQINVEREETTVTVAYQSDPEGAAKLAAWVSQMR
jgi:hypothetical protein